MARAAYAEPTNKALITFVYDVPITSNKTILDDVQGINLI
jgi:hypothetical protein